MTETRSLVRRSGGRHLMDGTAAFESNTLHLAARLIDVRDHAELWSNHFDIATGRAARAPKAIAAQRARAVA